MRLLCLLSLAPLLLAQPQAKSDNANLVADKLERTGDTIHGTGHARVTFGNLTISADEATLRRDTERVELRGHVHIILPARDDHTLIRYGSGNLLTDQPIGLSADRVTVHAGLLLASGNIVIVPTDPDLNGARLHGDEMSMFLTIGDATLKGNVRAVKMPDNTPPQFPQRTLRSFPPDIVKQR